MADDIVILSDSDDDNTSSAWSRETTPTLTNSIQQQKNQHGKRKVQQQSSLDDEAPASKRPTFCAETSARNTEQRANCGTPKLPQIVAVETLATPSATPPLQLLASPPRNTNATKDTRNIVASQPPSTTVVDVDSPKNSKEAAARRVKLTTVLQGSDDAWQELRQKRLQTGSSIGLKDPSESNKSEVNKTTTTGFMDLTHSPPTKESDRKTDNKSETKTEDKSETKTETKIEIENNASIQPATEEKRPLEKEYEELIAVCRKADPSADMQKLIDSKLLKYYHGVHPDFVKSRGFRKTVCICIERIRAEPGLVYYNLKSVVDELNIRRKSKDVIITNDEASPNASCSNGVAAPAPNKHTEEQIKKLNKALYVLKKRIYRLEESDVDLDDDNSSYLQVERYKKRACQIYEKICDLTGESKHARRLVKKPIQFSGTSYPAFNKTLQAYINRTKEFPDFFDVLRMMEHCNRQYDLGLANFEMKRIAQDAFLKVGKILQSRRKTDLYETVSHFTANMEDPAKSDPDLLAKLNENQKTQTRISEILETYARAQDDPYTLEQLKKMNEETLAEDELEENGNGSDQEVGGGTKNKKQKNSHLISDDESDDDEDDDEALDEHVEKLTKDNTIDLSDEEVELDISSHEPATATGDKEKEINTVNKTEKREIKNNADLKLTENNNIMRTKTKSDEETKVSAVEKLSTSAAETTIITVTKNAVVLKTIAPTQATASQSQNIAENSACPKDNVTSGTAQISAPSKTAAKDPTLLRTIAEIVISDEE